MKFAQASDAQYQSRLAQLPREILLQILAPLLCQPEVLKIRPQPWHWRQRSNNRDQVPSEGPYRQSWKFTTSILRCCQLLHHIGHSILYGANTLAIDWSFSDDESFCLLYDSAQIPDAWALRQQSRRVRDHSVGLSIYYGTDGKRPEDSVVRLPLQTIQYLLRMIQKFRVSICGNVEAHLVATRIRPAAVERACLVMEPVLREKEVEFFMQSGVFSNGQYFDLPWSEEVLSAFRVLCCTKACINGIDQSLARRLENDIVNQSKDPRRLEEGEYLTWKEISTHSPLGLRAILEKYEKQLGKYDCEFYLDDYQRDLRLELGWDFEKRVTWSYAA